MFLTAGLSPMPFAAKAGWFSGEKRDAAGTGGRGRHCEWQPEPQGIRMGSVPPLKTSKTLF